MDGSIKPPITKAWPNPGRDGAGWTWRETSWVRASRCRAHCGVLGESLPIPMRRAGCQQWVQAGILVFFFESGLEQCFESSVLPHASHT